MISNMMTMNIGDINPLIVTIFNLMGVWPIILACILLFDREKRPVPAWPFVIGTFFLGSYVLLPYLGLRRSQPVFSGTRTRFIKIIDSRITGICVLIVTLVMLIWGLTGADWADFREMWRSNMFINVMSIDFAILCLFFPFVLPDDMARRDWDCPALLEILFLLPMIGAAIYLAARPPVKEEDIRKEYDE